MVPVVVGVGVETLICLSCSSVLTAEEREYYEYRCEKCEREWFERIQAWLNGAADKELDACFSAPKPTVQ